MPVAHSSRSEKSVGAGSPRKVSVSSRLRRVAASRRTYSPARSAVTAVTCASACPRLAGVFEERPQAPIASVRSSQPKPASVAAPSCLRSFFLPLSTSNCQGGSRVGEVALQVTVFRNQDFGRINTAQLIRQAAARFLPRAARRSRAKASARPTVALSL